jgi:hypothetical protein
LGDASPKEFRGAECLMSFWMAQATSRARTRLTLYVSSRIVKTLATTTIYTKKRCNECANIMRYVGFGDDTNYRLIAYAYKLQSQWLLVVLTRRVHSAAI